MYMYIFHGKVKDTRIFTGEFPRSCNPQKELELVLRVYQHAVVSAHHLSPLFLHSVHRPSTWSLHSEYAA